MGPVWAVCFACSARFYGLDRGRRGLLPGASISVIPRRPWRTGMEDLFYIGLTIVVFGVLWLILKGVERFER